MLPLFTLVMARNAVASQFDYDDTLAEADVAPAAQPRRRPSTVRAVRRRMSGSFVRATWSPTR